MSPELFDIWHSTGPTMGEFGIAVLSAHHIMGPMRQTTVHSQKEPKSTDDILPFPLDIHIIFAVYSVV